MARIATMLIGAALAGYVLHALAQGQFDARRSVKTIGTSSSNGMSFAWFFDPSDRTVYVCRAGQAAGDAVDCRSKTVLP